MQFLFLITSLIALMFGTFSSHIENFYCETFYTKNTWESSQHTDHYIKSIEIDASNADMSVDAVDYDEGVVQIYGRNFEENFVINKVDDRLYIKSKQNECSDCKFSISLPVYYKNNVKLNIKSQNGNVFFSGNINVDEISCSVDNGDISGDILIANKIDFKTDETHTPSFNKLVYK